MRKFLFRLLAFTIVLFVILRLAGIGDNSFEQGNQNIKRIQLAADHDSLNVLFIGNSYAYSSVMPTAFDSLGLKTFNLGTASAGPLFYEIIANDYLRSCSELPEKVVLTLSPITFSVLSDNFEKYPIHRYLKRPLSNERVAVSSLSLCLYFSLTMKSADKVIRKTWSNQGTNDNTRRITPRGFFASQAVYSDSVYLSTATFYQALESDDFDHGKGGRLKKLAANLKQQGIEIVFFEPPTNRLTDFLNPEFLKEYSKFKFEIDEDYPLLSFPELLPDDHYRNIDHTNTLGAMAISRYLANEFKVKN